MNQEHPSDSVGSFLVRLSNHIAAMAPHQRERQAGRLLIEAKALLTQLHGAAIRAIDAEPELPGDMPDELWDMIHNDKDAALKALRIAVRQTKDGIRQRMLSPEQEPNKQS